MREGNYKQKRELKLMVMSGCLECHRQITCEIRRRPMTMAFFSSLRLVLLLVAVLVTGTVSSHLNTKIRVGGASVGWQFGVNYTEWAAKAGPFYVNDTLVFTYKPFQLGNQTIYHNVWRMKDYKHFNDCDFSNAIQLANASKGDSFQFVLQKPKAYFFACASGDGFHCQVGLMKFVVKAQVPGKM